MIHVLYYVTVIVLILRLGNGNEIFTSCRYKFSENGTNVPIVSKDETASSSKYTVFFNLCDSLTTVFCGEGVQICFKKHEDDDWFIAGSELTPNYSVSQKFENQDLLQVNRIVSPFCDKIGKKASIAIRFVCFDDAKENPEIIEIDECSFEIRILNSTCTPRCTVRVINGLIDLRSLANVYNIPADHGLFSIGVCTSNPNCDENISSCLIKAKVTTPLSSAFETIRYNEDTAVIKFEAKFKGSRKSLDRVLQIEIKCDWTRAEPSVHFVSTKGKISHFEMSTVHACVKIHHFREVRDGYSNFNLDSLYNTHNYWRIHLDDRKEILFNLSGSLNFPSENICSKTFSQVCLKNGFEFFNLGSIQTPLKLNDNVLSMSFASGEPCSTENNSTHYRYTTIDFYCYLKENGPQLDYMNACETRLKWKTPEACPKNDKSACQNKHDAYQNCILLHEDSFFNITGLFKKYGKYTVYDANGKDEYFLNICGSVFTDIVPCSNNNSAILWDKTEIDQRKSLVSLGKMQDFYYKDNHLVIEMTSGKYCEPHDYKSVIYLKCSDKEGEPQLKHKSKCRYEFIWETQFACPIINPNASSNCAFDDHSTSQVLDFKDLTIEHFLKVTHSSITYIFDLCSRYKNVCNTSDHCVHVSPKKHILTYGTNRYVEFILNKSCHLPTDFNRTLMEILCEPIENNDHYVFSNISNCVFKYKLYTHLACGDQNVSLYSVQETKVEHIGKQAAHSYGNCSVSNPKTHYTFSLNNLKLNFSTNECPIHRFNFTEKTTELIYDSHLLCSNQESGVTRFHYYVILKCSDIKSHKIQKNLCNHTYNLEEPHYCKLLENASPQDSLHWAAKTGIGLAVIIVIVILCVFVKMWYTRKKRPAYDGIGFSSYCKNGDL